MKSKGVIIVVASAFLGLSFLTSVFVNLGIKSTREKKKALQEEISSLILDIKRYEIEEAHLKSPADIYRYAKKRGFKSVGLKDIVRE